MATETQAKKTALIEELQKLGVENVNPNASLVSLEKLVELNRKGLQTALSNSSAVVTLLDEERDEQKLRPVSDTDRILMAIGGLATRLDATEKEIGRMKDKGVNDYKMDMKDEDVAAASQNKSNVDPRIVRIVEETLGVDFGIELESYNDKPGVMLHILVPRRLSMVPTAFRPVRDPESGKYMVDPKTQQVVEEEYWPGDKRSLSMGVSSSYELIQQHCNRVRSFIISWYQKMSKPIPTFNLK